MTRKLVRGDSMALEVDELRARWAQYMREAITQAALPGAAQTPSVPLGGQLSAMIDQITERNRKTGAIVHKPVYQMIH